MDEMDKNTERKANGENVTFFGQRTGTRKLGQSFYHPKIGYGKQKRDLSDNSNSNQVGNKDEPVGRMEL